jgi:hypothetical protein
MGLSWCGVGPDVTPTHAMGGATGTGAKGFGAQWYLWVARPIFLAFVVIWLWRTLLLGIALRRLATLGFSLVPTHPDRAGGIGFFSSLPTAFGVVAFALSSVIAAGWAHDVAHHDASVLAVRVPMVATIALLSALFLAPLVHTP